MSDKGRRAAGKTNSHHGTLASSSAATRLISGNGSVSYALGLEAGQQFQLTEHWSATPQAQVTYSTTGFNGFTDAYGAAVSLTEGNDLNIRLGLSADYRDTWTDQAGGTSRLHAYGITNLYYDALPQSRTDLSGVALTSTQDSLWGGFGTGGTYSWADGKYALSVEAGINTSLINFGRSYTVAGTSALTVKF